MKKTPFSLSRQLAGFRHAFNGLKVLLVEEHNARIHLFAALTVIILSFYFDISQLDWILIIIAIISVFVMECINTAIENVANAVTLESNRFIKNAKDVAAAAVLLTSINAVCVGVYVFFPHIKNLF